MITSEEHERLVSVGRQESSSAWLKALAIVAFLIAVFAVFIGTGDKQPFIFMCIIIGVVCEVGGLILKGQAEILRLAGTRE